MIWLVIALVVGVSFVVTGKLIDAIDRKNFPDGFPPGSMWG